MTFRLKNSNFGSGETQNFLGRKVRIEGLRCAELCRTTGKSKSSRKRKDFEPENNKRRLDINEIEYDGLFYISIVLFYCNLNKETIKSFC